MKLLGYWRSSATYRVRIALALKGLDYDYQPVNLLKGEQSGAEYTKKNPQALVPTLVTDAGEEISQSLAIIEFLQETFPSPSVLPKTPILRAKARAIAAAIACEAQPFANLRIQKYLTETLGVSDEAKAAFLNRWPGGALNAVEAMACETAVVASDVGGIPEVVADGETGTLVHYDADDPGGFETDLASAINAVILDPSRADAMGKAGRERAVREFGWDAAARKTVAIYDTLL